jgi:hypothetical protein
MRRTRCVLWSAGSRTSPLGAILRIVAQAIPWRVRAEVPAGPTRRNRDEGPISGCVARRDVVRRLKGVGASFIRGKGIERKLVFQASVNPDCSAMDGTVEARVVAAPSHGTIKFESGDAFPNYNASSPLAKCNNMKVKGLCAIYQSEGTFVGEDSATLLYLLPGGLGVEYTLNISVR